MNKNNVSIACGLIVVLFPIYLYTMTPTVSFGDSGEFIAAAETLGLAHAPSYPLFTLLGKCFIAANPFAHIAYSVNLSSLVFGIGTAVLFFFLACGTGCSPLISLIASLTLAFSGVLWDHSIAAEVFSLNAFFTVLIPLVFLLNPASFPLARRVFLCSFLFGLGLGNHHTLVMIFPAMALLYLREQIGSGVSISNGLKQAAGLLPLAFFFFLLGFSVYLFLPIRSFKNPPLDWSNPETVKNFIRVVTRADYGSLSLALGEKLPRNLESAWKQTARYFSFVGDDLRWVGLLLSLAGWALWSVKDFMGALSFFALFAVSGIGFLILGNMPMDSQSSGILPRFYLMSSLPLLLSLAWCLEWIRGTRARHAVFAGFLLPLFLLWNAHGHRTFSRSDFTAYDYGRNLLQTLPPGAILFMDGGDDTFYTLAYLTMAEKRRGDLEIHDRGGLIYRNPYGGDFRKITKQEKQARRQEIESAFLKVRPLFYATFDRHVLSGAVLLPRGILYRAVPENLATPRSFAASNPWPFYSTRGIYETLADRPYRLRALVPLYPFLEGIQTANLGLMRRAAAFGTDILWLKTNIVWEMSMQAYVLTTQNRFNRAEDVYRFIMGVDPDYAPAYANLGILMEKKNDSHQAEALYQRAIEADPAYADAYYDLGVLYWNSERWDEVIQLFEKTLQINPKHPSAARFLAVAKMKKAVQAR